MKKDKERNITTVSPQQDETSNFKLTRGKIKAMYADDYALKNNAKKTQSNSTNISSLTLDSFSTQYFRLSSLDQLRKYSQEAYSFYPIYQQIIDTLSNMFQCKYIYIPQKIKDKQSDFAEIYNLMGQVVDGLSLETMIPDLLTQLFIEGVVNISCIRTKTSNTISTLVLPAQYCRRSGKTQFGTYIIQFDMSYFDKLGFTAEQLEEAFNFYPKEFRTLYAEYKADSNKRWQPLDSRYSTAIQLNLDGFPTKLKTLFALKRYDKYADNELERNTQQLEKIITHVMPTWEDKLVVEIDEMTELHASISKRLSNNTHCRLITTFGDVDVKSISQDQTKENKSLINAYNAIYNDCGENQALYSSEIEEALQISLRRTESIVFKYIKNIINFYNIVINNEFNFGGYQCNLEMLPVSNYNYSELVEMYRQSATLGINKLDFIVASGTKQVYLSDKLALEDYLQLDKLKPLSTSYTQNDNAVKSKEKEVIEEDEN